MDLGSSFSDTAIPSDFTAPPAPLTHTTFVVKSSATLRAKWPEQPDPVLVKFWKEELSSIFPSGYRPVFLAPGSDDAIKRLRGYWLPLANDQRECDFRKNDSNASSGGFSAFIAFSPYHGEQTLRPKVIVRGLNKDGTAKMPQEIECSLMHEGFHREQTAVADITHADIANSASPIVLSPRDKMKLVVLTEADAAAKTAYLASNAAQKDPVFKDMLGFDALSVREFEDIMAAHNGDIQEAIKVAAIASMQNRYGTSENGEEWTYRDYYQDYVLDTYIKENSLRLRVGEKIEFVRLKDNADNQSLMKVGDALGINPFSQDGNLDPRFYDEPPLKPSIARKLHAVEAALGIHHDQLRGYNEALEAWGLDPQEYMNLANGNPPPQPFPFLQDEIDANAHYAPVAA